MIPAAPAAGRGQHRKRTLRGQSLGALLIALGLFGASPATAQSNTPTYPTCISLGARDAAVHVTWCLPGSDGGSPITGYRVWYGETRTPNSDPVDNWILHNHNSLDRYYTIQNLTNGKRYGVRVQAVNANGPGGLSTVWHMNLPDVIPPAATQPGVTGKNAAVDLTWTHSDTNSTAITKWEYDKKLGEGDWEDTWADICETSSNGGCPGKRAFTVSDLTNGTAYKFKVRAVNRIGNGTESPESASVTPSTTPAKPGTPTVTGGDQQVTLTWTPGVNGGSAVTGWEVRKQEAVNEADNWEAWAAIPNSGAGTTSHTVTGLTNGTAYRFQVRAVNANGDGAASPATNPVTPAAASQSRTGSGGAEEQTEEDPAETPPSPSRPSVAADGGQVTLTWSSRGDGGSRITRWQYAWKTDGDYGPWTNIPGSGANTASFTVTGLTNGRTYRFRVRAVNAVGPGSPSAESAPAMPGDAPFAASKPAATAGYEQVTLAWASGGDGGIPIAKWQYRMRAAETEEAASSNWTDVPGSGPWTTHTTVTGLTNGTAYRFQVRAVNAAGPGSTSPWSDAVTPVDAAPDFGDARIADQRYERGVPIAPLTLPEATGGDGALTYALAPALPAGLVFDEATRTVTGTPTDVAEAATWNWTATDSDPTDPDTASSELPHRGGGAGGGPGDHGGHLGGAGPGHAHERDGRDRGALPARECGGGRGGRAALGGPVGRGDALERGAG